MARYIKIDDVMDLINTSNRGNCDYFIVDQIEELCVSDKVITDKEIRNKAIDEFAEQCKQNTEEMFGQKYVDARIVDEIAEQLKQ